MDIAGTARLLARDIDGRADFRFLRGEVDDIATGYMVQDALNELRVAEGRRLAGYKVAVSSKAQQEMLGVREPCSGAFFDHQVHRSPVRFAANSFRTLVVEPEIVIELGADVPADGAQDTGSVASAVARMWPAFELVDLRGIAFSDMHLPSAVAQNVTCAGVVLGGPGMEGAELDAAGLVTRLGGNGQPKAEVTGGAPQHPLEALAWVANHIAGRGHVLRAGMLLLCGTHCPPVPVSAPAEVTAEMSGLGTVSFRLG
jgi:2-keto-4-pentenoate hydratase